MARHTDALRKLLCDIFENKYRLCGDTTKRKKLNLSDEVFFLLNMMIGALSNEFCSSFQELRKQIW